MTREQCIRALRAMLTEATTQEDFDTLCAAIRFLGANP